MHRLWQRNLVAQGENTASSEGGKTIRCLLRTPRLQLRELRLEDWKTIYAYCSLPIMRGRVLHSQTTREGIYQFVQAAEQQSRHPRRNYYALGLVLPETGELIGTCALKLSMTGRTGKIGWDLNVIHWGKGYMTEAAAALIAFAFRECGVERIYADVFFSNKASIRVMEKLGMQPEQLDFWNQCQLVITYQVFRRFVRYVIHSRNFPAEE